MSWRDLWLSKGNPHWWYHTCHRKVGWGVDCADIQGRVQSGGGIFGAWRIDDDHLREKPQ